MGEGLVRVLMKRAGAGQGSGSKHAVFAAAQVSSVEVTADSRVGPKVRARTARGAGAPITIGEGRVDSE